MLLAVGRFDLRVRNLSDGELGVAELDDEASAATWLKKRPAMVEVVGMATEGVSVEVQERLRRVMRPLDAAEEAALARLDAEAEAARVEAEQQAEREGLEAARAHAEQQRTADPKRPMKIEYRFGELVHTDPADPRPITDAAREAVLAFVAERNEWVEGRGQVVGRAVVTVYPEDVPDGEERVLPGASFTPVSK